jgi:peptidyl-prolyl cis-trans isomerase A (cyclophilin A)
MKNNVDLPIVKIQTELGNITVMVDIRRAPITVKNFLNYVDRKLFDNTSFYRIVTPENNPEKETKISVVQGGLRERSPHLLPPIKHEPTNVTGLRHVDGTVSMSRRQEGTASGAFFICVGDQPALDFGGGRYDDGLGFAAFGRVVEGMDVVRRIWQHSEENHYLDHEIVIDKVFRRP